MAAGKTGNALLDAFPRETLSRLKPHLTVVDMMVGEDVYEPGERIEHVLFPTRGLISVVASMQDGAAGEILTTGREGMFSVAAMLGDERPSYRAMVQLPGHALRMKSTVFRQELEGDLAMRDVMLRYTVAVMSAIGQTAACNRLHVLEQRCARWLLAARDRADGDVFPMTHEFLAMMLGVRRAGVTIAAQALQSSGLITYNHGTMTIIDRDGLQQRACECYEAIRHEFKRLLDTPMG
jgi:CRP-like cAMP-binding protein